MRGRVDVLAWPYLRNSEKNSYTRRFYDELVKAGIHVEEFSFRRALGLNYQVLHTHWPEALLKNVSFARGAARLLGLTAVLVTAKLRRADVVWTVHNVAPHGGAPRTLVSLLRRLLNQFVDYQIHLSHATIDVLRREVPELEEKRSVVLPHGRYGTEYSVTAGRALVRRELGIGRDELTCAFVGNVSRYKGAADFVSAFQGASSPAIRAIVAGYCEDTELERELRAAASADQRIVLEFEWLSSDRMANLIAASDLVVLPYRRILNSGSVFVPLELGIPILAPATGSLPEMSNVVGGGWMRLYEGELSAHMIERALTEAQPSSPPQLSDFDWDTIGREAETFFRGLLRIRGAETAP